MVAEVYADNLGEEGIKILQENYKITQKDIQGTLGYYGSPNWAIEAGFSYPEGIEPTDDTPGQVLNFAIKEGVPEGAVEIVTYALRMIIAYEYQDEALRQYAVCHSADGCSVQGERTRETGAAGT